MRLVLGRLVSGSSQYNSYVRDLQGLFKTLKVTVKLDCMDCLEDAR